MMGFALMMNNKKLYLLALTLFLYGTVANGNCDFDDFPVMSEMRVQSVIDDANYNNRPMMVKSFYAEAGYSKVADYYHRKWEDEYDDTAFGIWHQITIITKKCMMTVQVTPQDDDSSHGRLIISNPPEADFTKIGGDVLAPADAVVVSDLATNDGPKKGRVTMLSSADSVSEVAEFYLSEMQNKGWYSERDFNNQGARVLVFRDGLNISNIALLPAGDGTTQILVNEVISR